MLNYLRLFRLFRLTVHAFYLMLYSQWVTTTQYSSVTTTLNKIQNSNTTNLFEVLSFLSKHSFTTVVSLESHCVDFVVGRGNSFLSLYKDISEYYVVSQHLNSVICIGMKIIRKIYVVSQHLSSVICICIYMENESALCF